MSPWFYSEISTYGGGYGSTEKLLSFPEKHSDMDMDMVMRSGAAVNMSLSL